MYSQDQEATLFFRDGTTLKGYASITHNRNIEFRLTLEDDPDEWKDIMVKAITFHGFDTDIRYEYQYLIKGKQHPLLLEVVEKGNVNLYKSIDYYVFNRRGLFPNDNRFGGYYNEVSKKNKYHYYIRKPNQKLVVKLNNRFYYKEAAKYFQDCPTLVEKINSKKYSKKRAIEIVQFYNDLCDDEIFQVYFC
ncbi:MAG: hypothetical protein QNK89_00715 [Lacinutrix sp.]|uniref:hypothetical protein n=1 Tax=Lacinutrix sp. TaxID=1937692 RepID=UPI0030A652DC